MPKKASLFIANVILVLSILPAGGCDPETVVNDESPGPVATPAAESANYPKIASWLAKKDEIIASGKPFDLVMSGWFTPEEASQLKSQNPDMLILAGLSLNWVWDNPDWMNFLITVANYGRNNPFVIDEEMYLHRPIGERCAFGWASGEWAHEEIYAMDPRNHAWVELITSFYTNVLEQPQHDGIIVDMVLEVSWCPDALSDEEWLEATKAIMSGIQQLNTLDKPVIFNAGARFSDIDAYAEFMDGYVMENFMGEQLKTTFDEGLDVLEDDFIVVYAVDTDDTGVKDKAKMRLGLALSLLGDKTYFCYDFGPRDHGQAWWFPEYDVNLGSPLGRYYEKDNAYQRDFENGTVVCAPYSDVPVVFGEKRTDVTTGQQAESFTVNAGDGRIFLK